MKAFNKTTTGNFKRFILSIYNTETLKMLLSFALSAFAAVLIITTLYSVFKEKQRNNEKEVITSNIMTDEGRLIKGWEMTPDLESAVEAGAINLKNITVIEEEGDITFDGADSNKLVVIDYRTEIEDNKNPQIYSDKYFEELKKKGKNVYVVRLIGLATEVTTNEGAE